MTHWLYIYSPPSEDTFYARWALFCDCMTHTTASNNCVAIIEYSHVSLRAILACQAD